MEQEYYIGLDIGTSSVGWAVTDMNYQIIRDTERHCGAHGCLLVQILQKNEEDFGRQEGD